MTTHSTLAAGDLSPADALKREVARAALAEVVPGELIGVGTGSTVNFFIEALGEKPGLVSAAVSSSLASTARLQALGIEVLDLNEVVAQGRRLPVYVDGADEINGALQMIKGGGAALTREKIVAAACERFVCIVDQSKVVQVLGRFALPVEVIPMARASIERRLRGLGGEPRWRKAVVTDNGNHILDVSGLHITDAATMETTINQWPGVVAVGLFAIKGADLALVGTGSGVTRLTK
jgi:ribose 5-phosphate isomerase A